jgi:hypothetical protein
MCRGHYGCAWRSAARPRVGVAARRLVICRDGAVVGRARHNRWLSSGPQARGWLLPSQQRMASSRAPVTELLARATTSPRWPQPRVPRGLASDPRRQAPVLTGDNRRLPPVPAGAARADSEKATSGSGNATGNQDTMAATYT